MQETTKNTLHYWLEIIGVALVYIATAKIGQVFAIPPGNITPVWLPSGIMLALVLIRGYHIWPGIFAGAFVGNVWAYIDLTSIDGVMRAMTSGTVNGLGDVLASVGMVYLLRRISVTSDIFEDLPSLWPFLLLGAFLGPLISALFGVTSLAAMGFVSWDTYVSSLVTWWTGDAVGVFLLTPLILFFHRKSDISFLANRRVELSFYLIVFTSLCSFMWFNSSWPEPLPAPLFFTVPILLWAVLRLGFRVTFISTLLIAAIAIWSSSHPQGPFPNQSKIISIIELQLYLSIVIVSVMVVGIVSAQRDRLFKELQLKHDHDLLTGAYTRSCFIRLFDSEAQRLLRYGTQFCLIMFDIDYFKKVNDNLGHETGDEVLRVVCLVINKELRDIDSLTRWGGEEFLILLPSTTLDGGYQFSERCREKIAQYDFHINQQITISLGLVQPKKDVAMKNTLKKVDDAMYLSKHNGRNQTTVADSE